MCGSRKNPYHPMEGHWKFLGGGGVLKAKFLEEMYENKLEFPGGRGVCKTKTFHGGSMDIFWNCTIRSSGGAVMTALACHQLWPGFESHG